MKAIWKQQFSITDDVQVDIPKGSKIISVQYQGEYPTIWFECDVDVPIVARCLRVYGTGHQHTEICGTYLGTLQVPTKIGQLVWHVYDMGEMQ